MRYNSINMDPDILGGTPVFTGTRVPIQTLFDYIETGETIEEFLENFPTVKKEQAIEVIKTASEFITNKRLLNENIA